jgi:apolipoprotein N-acyltransferase
MVDSYNRRVRSLVVAVLAALLLVLAFPPFGWGFLTLPAVALFLWELRSGRHPLAAGAIFGLAFFSGLIWWISKLGLIAVAPLVAVFSLYFLVYGWLLGKAAGWVRLRWWFGASGGWALMEAIRVRFPAGGFEWGLLGYPLGEYGFARGAAQWVGATGWGTITAALAAAAVVSWEQRRWRPLLWGGLLVASLGLLGWRFPSPPQGPELRVAVVQGSTPCPLTHCPGERLATYRQHLALTATIPAGAVDLVVWSEGSTGALDADPILRPEVAAAIGEQAARIGAYMLVGGDRPISDTHWINANVVFAPDGTIVGEYRKRHPVPFGEYIPFRPLFDWIPVLDQVPRDMIPGEGPKLFDVGRGLIGSVISFEGAFARYPRQTAAAGGQLLVVATNEGSYNFTPVSDQFIGMTRMRAAELGMDVVHSAVTGKSTFLTQGGRVGEVLDFTEQGIITASLHLRQQGPTLYTRLGEWVQALAVLGLALASLRRWHVLPGSAPMRAINPRT